MALPFILGKQLYRAATLGVRAGQSKTLPALNKTVKRFWHIETCGMEEEEEEDDCGPQGNPYQNYFMNVRERYREFNIDPPFQPSEFFPPDCRLDPCGPLLQPVRMDWVYPPKRNHSQPWDQNWDECCPPPPPPIYLCDPEPEPCYRPLCTNEQVCISTACRCPPPTCGDCCLPDKPMGCNMRKPPCPGCTKYKS